jgi:hypothetical protein
LREAIDIAWESNSNRAVIFWGDGTVRQIAWRTWTPGTSTLTAKVTLQFTFPGGYTSDQFEWVRLYSGPNDVIIAILQTGSRALLATLWDSGTAVFTAASLTGLDTDNNGNAANGVESAAARSFDFAWEQQPKSSGKGWLLWGSRTATAGIRTQYFTSPSTWGAAAVVRDRTLLMQAGALSPSGRFVAGAYQATASTNDDTESLTTIGGGAVWPNASTALWAGATTVQQGERVFVVTREGARINTGASGTGVVSILETHEVMPP